MLVQAKLISALAGSLILVAAAPGGTIDGMSPRAGAIRGMPLCNDARYSVGTNLPDQRDVPSGDIRVVEALLDGDGANIGYRYTLNDGRAYVSDRSRALLTLGGLAKMNELVNAMSSFSYNAFGPRDNGYTAYRVTWRAATAWRLQVTAARCFVKKP